MMERSESIFFIDVKAKIKDVS